MLHPQRSNNEGSVNSMPKMEILKKLKQKRRKLALIYQPLH